MSGFEEYEFTKNAHGGTELAKRSLQKLIDQSLLNHFQIIPSRIRDLRQDSIRILWLHDTPEDPEYTNLRNPDYRTNFHQFVFVSNWQYSQFQSMIAFPYDTKSVVIETGVEPAIFDWAEKKSDTIRIVYNTTPHRGLEILVPVFEALARKHKDIHLDVFSSMKIYGLDEADQKFVPLYDRIRGHSQMTYHGFVHNEPLRRHLNRCHIHAYPCIWRETSCRSLIEAMSAGLVCVHPNYAALPDTSGGLNLMYQGDLDLRSHTKIFAESLERAIDMVRTDRHQDMVRYNKSYADKRFDINAAADKWKTLLTRLSSEYASTESRGKIFDVNPYRNFGYSVTYRAK